MTIHTCFLRQPMLAQCMLALCMLLSLAPLSAYSKPAARQAAPKIENFYVTPQDQITPGTELSFTVEGTPRGKATVRISGINRTINLRETDHGVYEGSYTVTNRDRLSARTIMQATLRSGSRSTVASHPLYSEAALSGNAPTPVPIVTDTPSSRPGQKNIMLAIERFFSPPVARIEPGIDLRFFMRGTPGARASFRIEDVTRDIAMQETRSGRYEGSYTVRQADRFPPNVSVIGTLESRGQVVRSQLSQPLQGEARSGRSGDNSPPLVRNLSPREGETVNGNIVSISGNFDDPRGVGVDPRNVRIMIDGNDVTRNAIITAQSFSFRADLQPGMHPVEVTVRDLAGNSARQAWSFNVSQPLPPGGLPLTILSPGNNAHVSGGAEIRGRTVPDAQLDVQVVAGAFGMAQPIFTQSLRSDATGGFGFSFSSPVVVPGTRYEVIIDASRGEARNQVRLNLFQQ